MMDDNNKKIVEKVTEGGVHRDFSDSTSGNLPPVDFTRTAFFSKIRNC